MSIQLLQLFSEKENYERWGKFIKEHTVSPEVWAILQSLDKWYVKHGDVDWEDYATWFKVVMHPTMKPARMKLFELVFEKLDASTDEVDSDIIDKFVVQDYCTQIADITLKGAEGESIEITDVECLVKACNTELDSASNLEKYLVTDSLDDILTSIDDSGYDWRLDFLNHSVGRLRAGKLVCLAARPGTGKTTFLASEATFVAKQLPPEECVIWFNNEEAGSEVKFRTVQAATQATHAEVTADPVKATANYEGAVGGSLADRIVIVDKSNINIHDVEEYLRMYTPGLIIFDQLWKVKGFEKTSSSDTARLGNIFQWAREIAKDHAAVITVHQLNTGADGNERPKPSDLYLSGTVIQGEVDCLILMGNSYNPSVPQDERCISIGKNKGAYGPSVDPALREGSCYVDIIPERAYFKER